MEAKVESQFKGTINGVVIQNESEYYTTLDVIQKLEDKFDIPISDKNFTSDLADIFHTIQVKNDADLNYSYLHGTFNRIDEIDDIKDFAIMNEWQTEPSYEYAKRTWFGKTIEGDFNKAYRDGKYNLSNKLAKSAQEKEQKLNFTIKKQESNTNDLSR